MSINKDIVKLHRARGPVGRMKMLRLDMNENPEGLPHDFIKKFTDSITPEDISMYPESDNFVEICSSHLQLPIDYILPTNGSDMGIRMIFEVYSSKNHNIVTVSPTFEMYRINAEMRGLNVKAVRYNSNLEVKVEDIINAIDSNTDIVVIVNPNNPVGNVFNDEEVTNIINCAREFGAIVIIDEAYHYFYKGTFVDKVKKFDNVIVLRTFSKLMSMAGCRLGLVVSNPTIIQNITKTQLSFDVNSLALKLGEMILRDENLIQHLITEENEGREYMESYFRENNYESFGENGNYIFFKPKTGVDKIYNTMQGKGILVKTYSDCLLKDYVRVTIGSKRVMKRFTDCLSSIDK